jgi:hypothetical protein
MVVFRARSWKESDNFDAAALANGAVCDSASYPLKSQALATLCNRSWV